MYVYTLKEFILVDVVTMLCMDEVISIGKYTHIYTITKMDEKCSWRSIYTLVLIELQLHEKLSLGNQDVLNAIPLFDSHFIVLIGITTWLLISQTTGEIIECWFGNSDLLMTKWASELILFLPIVSYHNRQSLLCNLCIEESSE